jgi:hypothetical protein
MRSLIMIQNRCLGVAPQQHLFVKGKKIPVGGAALAARLPSEEVLVMPTGGRAGGLLYKYRIICRGVEILIHSNPPMGRQGIRFRYFAESLQGGRDRFYNTHFEFLIPFITRLGFTIEDEKLSRVDANVNLSVSMAEFSRLKQNGHIVRKARKRAFYGTDDVVDETIGPGSTLSAWVIGSPSPAGRVGSLRYSEYKITTTHSTGTRNKRQQARKSRDTILEIRKATVSNFADSRLTPSCKLPIFTTENLRTQTGGQLSPHGQKVLFRIQ